jgi:cold shock CspA family protein
MNLTRTIKSIINNRKELLDKNRNNYLILELESGESIFVFDGKVNSERWSWLEEGKAINFTVEEGKNGANLLVDYVIEV